MSIGASLAEARERAGLTVDQISQTTRIRAGALTAMEHDDFSNSGGDVYARGHLRSFAVAVGLDPEPLIAEFNATRGGAVPQPLAEAAEMATALQPERRAATATADRRGPNWSAAMLVAIVVVVVIGGIALLARTGGSTGQADPPQAGNPTSGASTTPDPAQSSPKPDPTTSTPPIVATRDGVTVVIRVLGDGKSWVSATGRNDRVIFEGLLESGERKVVKDKRIVRLVLGSAGSVNLKVNGVDVGSPGESGEVRTVEFGPGDPTDPVQG